MDDQNTLVCCELIKPQDNDHVNQMSALKSTNKMEVAQPLKQITKSKSPLLDDFELTGNQDRQMILDTNEQPKTEPMM